MLFDAKNVKFSANFPGTPYSTGENSPPLSLTRPFWSTHEAVCALQGIDTKSLARSCQQIINYGRLRSEARLYPLNGLDFTEAEKLLKLNKQMRDDHKKLHQLLTKALRSRHNYKPQSYPSRLTKSDADECHLLPITVLIWAIKEKLTIPDELNDFCQNISILSDSQSAEFLKQNQWQWFEAIYYLCGLMPPVDCSENNARRHFPILSDHFFKYELKQNSLRSKLKPNGDLTPAIWHEFWRNLNWDNSIESNDNRRTHTKDFEEKVTELAWDITREFFIKNNRIPTQEKVAEKIAEILKETGFKKTNDQSYGVSHVLKIVFQDNSFDRKKCCNDLKKSGTPLIK